MSATLARTPERVIAQYLRPTQANREAATEIRAAAARHHQDAADSFERCDTDGFLTQWASGLNGQKQSAQARIVEQGGVARFDALFDLQGNWVPARLIDGQWGTRWMVLDHDGRSTGTFLPFKPVRRSTLASRGYVEGEVLRPAYADFEGRGRGLSGSCWVVVRSSTKPHEPPAAILTTDRWSTQ